MRLPTDDGGGAAPSLGTVRVAMRTRTFIGAAAVLLGCSACGFKGPLYLPPHHGTVVTRPAPAAVPSTPHKTQLRKTVGPAPPGPPT